MYCECGAKTPKSSTPVNFCSSCGEPFNKSMSKKPMPMNKPMTSPAAPAKASVAAPPSNRLQELKNQKKSKPVPVVQNEDDEDETDDSDDSESINYVPEVTENPFIVQDYKPQRIPIQNVMGTRDPNTIPTIDNLNLRDKPAKFSKKQMVEQIRKEASTFRKE